MQGRLVAAAGWGLINQPGSPKLGRSFNCTLTQPRAFRPAPPEPQQAVCGRRVALVSSLQLVAGILCRCHCCLPRCADACSGRLQRLNPLLQICQQSGVVHKRRHLRQALGLLDRLLHGAAQGCRFLSGQATGGQTVQQCRDSLVAGGGGILQRRLYREQGRREAEQKLRITCRRCRTLVWELHTPHGHATGAPPNQNSTSHPQHWTPINRPTATGPWAHLLRLDPRDKLLQRLHRLAGWRQLGGNAIQPLLSQRGLLAQPGQPVQGRQVGWVGRRRCSCRVGSRTARLLWQWSRVGAMTGEQGSSAPSQLPQGTA